MTESGSEHSRDESIAVHIFTVSAAMVGVCLTVIGIIHAVRALRGIDTVTDGVVALDAFGFLSSCLLAYAALHVHRPARTRHLERAADAVFLGALTLMAVCCALIACRLV